MSNEPISSTALSANEYIEAIRDDRNYLHAPLENEGGIAVCHIEGTRVWAPAHHTHRFCHICVEDTQNSQGDRLWPIVTVKAEQTVVLKLESTEAKS